MWMSGVRGQRSAVTLSYHGLTVDQPVDIRWRQETNLLQQVAVLPQDSFDLQEIHAADVRSYIIQHFMNRLFLLIKRTEPELKRDHISLTLLLRSASDSVSLWFSFIILIFFSFSFSSTSSHRTKTS